MQMNLVGFTRGYSDLLGQIYNSELKAVSNHASGKRVDTAGADPGGFSRSSVLTVRIKWTN